MNDLSHFEPPADPWSLFGEWLAEAGRHEINDPNAMALATVGENGTPSLRIMLLKGVEGDGFVFYTNRESRKGGQLDAHPKAAICFHWKSLGRQVEAEGTVARVTDAESDAYFASRPRGSQIGAWASRQSRPLESRGDLEARVKEFDRKFEGQPVPRPPHWGGYRLTPLRIEFWQAGEFRLHDRFAYRRASTQEKWVIERQNP